MCRVCVWRIMLRFGILVSVIPLLLTGGIVRDWFPADFQPCIPGATADVQVTRQSWLATRSVSFTDNPAEATVRVEIVDQPDMADLSIVDDGEITGPAGCSMNSPVRKIAITAAPVPGEPVIHMSREQGGDYRVYLASSRMSFQEVAALIVGAQAGQERLTAAAFRVQSPGVPH